MNLGELKGRIYWGLLILMLLGTLWVDSKIFFFISTIYYVGLVLKNRGKIWYPKVPGLGMYLIFVLFGTIIGLCLYPFRNVLRDLYYILPTIVWVFISYHLGIKNQATKKNIMATLYLYAGIVAVKSVMSFLIHPTLDFEGFREVFGIGVYDVGFIVPIMAMEVFFLHKVIFSKAIDRIIIVLALLQIVLSFGRVAILQPIVEFFVLMLLFTRNNKEYSKIMIRIIAATGVSVALVTVAFKVAPDSVTSIFMEKFTESFSEVDTSQVIDSVGAAMNNWRAYEAQAVWKQWGNSNIWVKVFGAGVGKAIHIDYIPQNWDGVVENNEIPLLHNGFYSLLPKGGLFAMCALGIIFLACIIKGYKLSTRQRGQRYGGIILAAVTVAAVVNTYVVRGPVQQGAFMVWAIIVGWMNSFKEKDVEFTQTHLRGREGCAGYNL